MTPAVQCEMQLINWGESASSGAWVKLWVDPADLDAFRAIRCRSGKAGGQRFAAVFVEIGDDEQPEPYQIEPNEAQQAERGSGDTGISPEGKKPIGGDLARLASQLCRNAEFQGWMCAKDEQEAAELVRSICHIESRAELDHNQEAAAIFHSAIRLPWLGRKGAA